VHSGMLAISRRIGLAIAHNADTSSWKAIRDQLKRRGIDSHQKYCRAIFATYLRKQGIESEVIDIYQGSYDRVPDFVAST
jgi:intergrase/recombinase